MVNEPDLSIWEPRGEKKNYTYSKVMMWVALDRGLRLAEKRCLPCPNRDHWLKTKDRLYEDIQMNSWK
jgi:GH15 family glucan-1,4-alpha-glucosidase